MNMVRHFFVSIIFLVYSISLSANKIIYLISPPRSLSVAFLRMMHARGDFYIMHEPSQCAFNQTFPADVAIEQKWFLSDACKSFEEVKKSIVSASQNSNVFVKEMSFAVHDFLMEDDELMQNPQIFFVFLVRNPHHSIISLYKRVIDIFDEVCYKLPDIVGYKALYDIFYKAKRCAVNKPYIILTEDLCNDTAATIAKFYTHISLDFKPESLHWQNLGDNFDGHTDWHEIKYKEITHHWHGAAIKSTCFGVPTMYEVDKDGNPTFAEISNIEHHKICKSVYLNDLPYYKLLLENSLNSD